jgi:hypothetical protein
VVLTPSSFVFNAESIHEKRQSWKNIAFMNINIENDAQINANVDNETKFLSIKIYN